MGVSVGSQIRAVSSSKMKFLAVAVALVAGVSAEADADAFYSPYALPYAYGAYAFGGKSAPCVNAANIPVPCAGAPLAYHGYPYAYYGKRDAEPTGDAATNPTLGHAVAYTPAGVTHSSNVGVCTNYL